MKAEKAIVIAAVISAIILLAGIILVGNKMNDDRQEIVRQSFFEDSTSSTDAVLSDPIETQEIGNQETEAKEDEKTADQLYLEWQVYQLLTDSIKNDSLRVNPSQIWCSERGEDGLYAVFGVFYIGTELHSITVFYESEGDGSVFNKDDFKIDQVLMDSKKVFPDEGQ